jgi:putative NADPH-quinone reductase
VRRKILITDGHPARHACHCQRQRDIEWADHIVMVFPLWLGSSPALVPAFLEQVACGGFFAETSGRGIRQKLKNKSARLIVTMGIAGFRLDAP